MAAKSIRKTGQQIEMRAYFHVLACLVLLTCYSANVTATAPGIIDGTTDGKLQSGASVDFTIGGVKYTKAATDDLWDLSAQTDTTASQYRAFWLYLNSSGTASIGAGSNAATAAAALAALPALDGTKSVIGVYVAGPSTDFNGAAGLQAQGTVYNGIPAGARVGTADPTEGTGQIYAVPTPIEQLVF
jgi:hypothetical protein